MTHEAFKHLFYVLSVRHPEQGFQYDGKDTISSRFSIHGCSGIWINIINDTSIDTDDYCSTSICMKNANGQLWERHISDLTAGFLTDENGSLTELSGGYDDFIDLRTEFVCNV